MNSSHLFLYFCCIMSTDDQQSSCLKGIVMCVSIGSVGLSLFVRLLLLANSHEEQKNKIRSRDLSFFVFLCI